MAHRPDHDMTHRPEHNQIPPEFVGNRSTEITEIAFEESEARKTAEAARSEKEQIDLTEGLYKEMVDILREAALKIEALACRTEMTVTRSQLTEMAVRVLALSAIKDGNWSLNAQRHYYFDTLLLQAGLTLDSFIDETSAERTLQTGKKKRISKKSIENLFKFNVKGGWSEQKRLDLTWREAGEIVFFRHLGDAYTSIVNLVFEPEDH